MLAADWSLGDQCGAPSADYRQGSVGWGLGDVMLRTRGDEDGGRSRASKLQQVFSKLGAVLPRQELGPKTMASDIIESVLADAPLPSVTSKLNGATTTKNSIFLPEINHSGNERAVDKSWSFLYRIMANCHRECHCHSRLNYGNIICKGFLGLFFLTARFQSTLAFPDSD